MNTGKPSKEPRSMRLPFGWRSDLNEKLLQFIWEFQYFNTTDLRTTRGESITIIHPGKHNTNQGPDFSDAQIRIDGTLLAGSVELHLRPGQWKEHGHDGDPNYRNVILHVVFEDDKKESSLPVLELQPLIPTLLLERYSSLMNENAFIPCSGSISQVPGLVWMSWKDRLLAERLTRKADVVIQLLKQNNHNWEETFWWLLARNFGMKVNGEAFEAMARSLPVKLLARHRMQIHQLEALLLGQAGLLQQEFGEDYPKLLQREYAYLRKKYGLDPIRIPVHFLRMRPVNFPTLRLAQLAMLLHQSGFLFAQLMDLETPQQVLHLFDVTANDFWHYHYTLEEASGYRKKMLGKEMAQNLFINTVVPVLFAYGMHHKDQVRKDKLLAWLEATGEEQNPVCSGFVKLGLENRSACDSQAFLELKTQYCDQRRCLNCAVGNALLKTT